MFSKEELGYLLACVDQHSGGTIQDAKNKAHMMMKLASLLEEPEDDSSNGRDTDN